MKCSEVRSFLLQINYREGSGPITPIPSADIDYLSANGYIMRTTKDDYDKGVEDVARLSQMTAQMNTERADEEQAVVTLQKDERKEHSFLFHFEGKEAKDELSRSIQNEKAVVSNEESELSVIEVNVNELIQKKSTIDRMLPYGDGYVSLTGLGSLTLNDLDVRNYRVADQEFPDFIAEIKATYAELRSIADKASSHVILLKPEVPNLDEEHPDINNDNLGHPTVKAPSLLWSTAIGLAKLQGDTKQIGERYIQAFNDLQNFDSTIPNKLMAAEIMTALSNQDLQSLESVLKTLDQQFRGQGVPKELSAGVAATIMAGRRYDGTYPTDMFNQFEKLTLSHEAQAILAVMHTPSGDLGFKFQQFRSMFTSCGYMISEDTEIASAFLAIGELTVDEVEEKLKYIIEQLKNYLEYPLVAAAILASIPVFESHEVLDLMEKAVTLLSGYAADLERSELVTLAVRMIHGVRNEIVKQIDPAAKIAETPVQFNYPLHPGFFLWYYPIIVAYSSYHSTFSGMGGFHPAHSHGVGGFAG
ncbi:MAG: hypothetical protein ABSA92_15450 [Candidatus Bathyarchaeia archaeon]|jgi:hypothetical protein